MRDEMTMMLFLAAAGGAVASSLPLLPESLSSHQDKQGRVGQQGANSLLEGGNVTPEMQVTGSNLLSRAVDCKNQGISTWAWLFCLLL